MTAIDITQLKALAEKATQDPRYLHEGVAQLIYLDATTVLALLRVCAASKALCNHTGRAIDAKPLYDELRAALAALETEA